MGEKGLKHLSLGFMLALMLNHAGIPGIAECQTEWNPTAGRMMSRFAGDVNHQNPLPEYPRPQLIREQWQNLNGLWEYAIRLKEQGQPEKYDGKILVPFPIESALSGVQQAVGDKKRLWYRRIFQKPNSWKGKRILLHFGAVDWETTLWINGEKVGTHRGGYDAFSYDITDAMLKKGDQEIVVSVWDPVDVGWQPRGKQVMKPRGIWYTSVTGLWQTVWLEPVPASHIMSLKIVPDVDKTTVSVQAFCVDVPADYKVRVRVNSDRKEEGVFTGRVNQKIMISIPQPHLWSPEDPYLYDLCVTLLDNKGKFVDEVSSYFGMRKITIGKDENGVTRLMLNNEPYFHFGPLDQGWWPDGLYTAPTDEALKYDIEVTKRLGFNTARKHVKIEPDRWYYWCDRLGLLVWQDMPSGDRYIGRNEPDITRIPESADQFQLELERMVKGLGNHPCIVIWVPYNEGWGQWDTPRITDLVKSWDPDRLVNPSSGWADRGIGDIQDIHAYPGPNMPEIEEKRAVVLGEFGGLGLPLKGHTWQEEDNWGYRSYQTVEDLTRAYENLLVKLERYKRKGLSAAIYTQTTDVEIEVNGLMTYDRKMIKMNPADVARINEGFLPPVIEAEDDIFLDEQTIRCLDISRKGTIRFTLDGNEPAIDSKRYEGPFQISETKRVKAATFWEDGTRSRVTSRLFKKVKLIEGERVDRLTPGLRYIYYENEAVRWEKIPDLSDYTPQKDGVTPQFSLDLRDRENDFAFEFRGYIDIPVDGIYSFFVNSDDGTRLFIGSEIVVDNDGIHGMTEKRGSIALASGKHPLGLLFFQGMGGKGLQVTVTGPKIEKKTIPSEWLYYQKK